MGQRPDSRYLGEQREGRRTTQPVPIYNIKMSEWDRIPIVFEKTTAPYAYIKKNTPMSLPNLDKPAARGRKHHPPSVYPAEWPRAAHFNFPGVPANANHNQQPSLSPSRSTNQHGIGFPPAYDDKRLCPVLLYVLYYTNSAFRLHNQSATILSERTRKENQFLRGNCRARRHAGRRCLRRHTDL